MGCLAIIILIAVFVWFVANNLETIPDRTPFGP
jgi:hypothetical protein